MLKKTIVMLVGIFIINSFAYSAPTVTSFNTTTGVLTGTNLGEHADQRDATPQDWINYKYRDFNTGTFTDYGFTLYTDGHVPFVFSSDASSRDGTQYVKRQSLDGFRDGFLSVNSVPGNITHYTSFWFRFDPAHTFLQDTANGKIFRFYANQWTDNISIFAGGYGTYPERDIRGDSNIGGSVLGRTYDGNANNNFPSNKWYRIEVLMQSPFGGGINNFEVWVDNQLVLQTSNWMLTDQLYDWSWQIANHFTADENQPTGGSEWWGYDDLYYSFSQARVEIGNNSVFSNCTHKELQLPIAATQTEWTIDIVQGTIPNNEEWYIFAIDENGDASIGYPITFSTGTAPKTVNSVSFKGVVIK